MAYQTRSRSDISGARVAQGQAASARDGRQVLAAEGVTYPLIVGIVHLLIVQTIASLAWRFGSVREGSGPQYLRDPEPIDGLLGNLVEPLRLWDGLWYKGIADFGYDIMANANPAYWPLLPWLMAAGERITGLPSETIGWGISKIAFVVGLGLVYQLIQIDFDRAVARRTLWALALFPTALFFSAIYTESLFLALAAGALLAARTRNWALAGFVGLLAALTRSQGVMLLAPFAVLFLQQYGWNPLRWFPRAIPSALLAALPILGPVLFYIHLDSQDIPQTVTEPAFVSVQGQWYRYSAPPWETLECAVSGCSGPSDHEYISPNFPVSGADWGWFAALVDDPTWAYATSEAFRDWFAQSDTLELVAFLMFVVLGVVGLRWLPLYHSAYLWPPLIFPLFQPSAVHPLMSLPRFGIVLFPLFVVLALLFRDRTWGVPALVVSTLLLMIFTAQFANWYWVS